MFYHQILIDKSTDANGNKIYPDGFFVNDYVYDGSGDLDEYNGRFCKTPEFQMAFTHTLLQSIRMQ